MKSRRKPLSKIRKSAEGEVCSVRIPGCPSDPQTVVFAHAPCVDKGMGLKSPDWWGGYACNFCHDVLDGRREHEWLNTPSINSYWHGAIYETQKKLIAKGLIKVWLD